METCVDVLLEEVASQAASGNTATIELFLAQLGRLAWQQRKQLQQEVRSFLAWLEQQIGVRVENLANKTRVKNYHEHNLDSLLEVLRQNCRRLRANPASREFLGALQREFQASVARLRPLKAQIAATDRLIDLAVYRLYGLSEAEIQIVEGEGQG